MGTYTLGFSPHIEVCALPDGRAAIVFDSGCEVDQKRSTVSHCLPVFKQLSLEVSWLDLPSDITFDFGAFVLRGEVALKITDSGSHESRVVLAECALELSRPPRSKGQKEVPPMDVAAAVRAEVRHAVIDAFTAALAAYYATLEARAAGAALGSVATQPLLGAPAIPGAGIARPRMLRGAVAGAAANDGTGGRRRMMMAILAGPVLVFGLWALTKVFSPAPTAQEQVAQAMMSDPQAIEASVELTRQTLREMGLDPGDGAADLGCLVQQP